MSTFLQERFRAWIEKPTGLSRAERAMHWLAMAACTFFVAVCFWEAFGPQRSGHYSTGAAYAIAGENMVHWHKFAAYCDYLLQPARPDQYYCHHPFGIESLDAIAYLIFGHHWFTTRAAAIFCSALSPPLIYGFGRRAWGVIPASIATIFFTFVPIDLAYATFGNLEVPTIFFGLLLTWATACLWERWRLRHVILAAIGAFGACNADWVGLALVGPILAFAFVRAYVLPRRFYAGRIDERRYAQWFAWVTAATVGTLFLYLALFGKWDKMGDLMGSYHHRSSGSEASWHDVFSQRRKLWLSITLTPISYGTLAVGIPLAVLRVVRKPLEIFPIAWAIAASFQYFVFKQGADIHIFWTHYYGPTAALAAGTITATLLYLVRGGSDVLTRLRAPAWTSRVFRVGGYAAVAVGLFVPLFLLARMGLVQLVQARKTAGRFDQTGHYMAPDADIAQFVEWALSNVATAGSVVQALDKMDFSYSSNYAAQRPHAMVPSLTAAKLEDPQRVAVVDTRVSPTKELRSIANDFRVQAVGPFWKVDRAEKGPAFTALEYREREPNVFEWMFVAGTDLVRTIGKREDSFATWQWRDALGLPATTPDAVPTSLDELVIAHNIAVSSGDTARASALLAQITPQMGRRLDIDYTNGVHLRSIDVHDGPAIITTLFWETDTTFKPVDANFKLTCKVTKPPRLWIAQTDYFDRDMAPVPPIRVAFWKPGYLYAQRFEAIPRVGREECRGGFSSEIHPKAPGPDPMIVVFE